MTYTLHHPRIPHVFVTVETDEEREAHKAAGWRVSEPPVFDNGGTLPEGLNKVHNDLGKPEPLVRPKRRK